jgi:hypothetical protein
VKRASAEQAGLTRAFCRDRNQRWFNPLRFADRVTTDGFDFERYSEPAIWGKPAYNGKM